MITRFRTAVPVIGLTTNKKTWRKLNLSWNILPKMCETFNSTDVLFDTAKNVAKEEFSLKTGDKIIITGGATLGKSGTTNLIKIEEI